MSREQALRRVRSMSCGVVLAALALPVAAQCPQYRETPDAPDEIRMLDNPLPMSRANLRAGWRLYRGKEQGLQCVACHGKKGDGRGPLALSFAPPPRTLTCAETMQALPDGQLFWSIREGIEGTAMPAHAQLTDEQVWQLVLVLREMSSAN